MYIINNIDAVRWETLKTTQTVVKCRQIYSFKSLTMPARIYQIADVFFSNISISNQSISINYLWSIELN